MKNYLRWTSTLCFALPLGLALVMCGYVVSAAAGFPMVEVGQTFRDCPDCPEMVVVPAASFLMGSSPAETEREIQDGVPWDFLEKSKATLEFEHPQHLVTISHQFAIAKYPATRGEFAAFVSDTKYSPDSGCVVHVRNRYYRSQIADWKNPGFSQSDRDPVVCINWQDAQAYIAWLNNKLIVHGSASPRGSYRLPSEAEWEYAARAGTATARWWGDGIGTGNAYCRACGGNWSKGTIPVGSYKPNSFGLYDVLGSVWQWTEDCWNETYESAPQDGGPWLSGNCGARVVRGGSSDSDAWVLTSAHRTKFPLEERGYDGGFRVVRTIE